MNERIKKAGGPSIYNTWLANEMNALCNAMNIMKNHLTVSLKLTFDLNMIINFFL